VGFKNFNGLKDECNPRPHHTRQAGVIPHNAEECTEYKQNHIQILLKYYLKSLSKPS